MNRGAHQTIGGGGAAGTESGGAGGGGGAGGQMTMTDGSQDQVADSGPDAIDTCDIDGGAVDAGDAGAPSTCLPTALFNFESPAGCGLYGATLAQDTGNPKNTDGFKRLYHTPVAYCGKGGMAIDVDLDGSTRLGGEVDLPITPTADFTGKTLSFAVKGSVGGGPNVRFQVLLVTTLYEPKSIDVPITTDWVPFSVVLPSTADASAMGVIRIALEIHAGLTPYVGTVYVDELDIRATSDAGASDGPPADAASTDVRDASSADVRDAPAGS